MRAILVAVVAGVTEIANRETGDDARVLGTFPPHRRRRAGVLLKGLLVAFEFIGWDSTINSIFE